MSEWSEWVLTGATVGLVIATTILGLLTGRLWKATVRLSEVTAQVGEKEERARRHLRLLDGIGAAQPILEWKAEDFLSSKDSGEYLKRAEASRLLTELARFAGFLSLQDAVAVSIVDSINRELDKCLKGTAVPGYPKFMDEVRQLQEDARKLVLAWQREAREIGNRAPSTAAAPVEIGGFR